MGDHELERRKMDEEFRRQLAERLKALEISFDTVREELKDLRKEIVDIKLAELDLHYTLFGGPKADDIGLLEKFRKLLYRFGAALAITMCLIAFAGKLISPMYNRIVADWLYNSVSERWLREKAQPHIKKYIIHQKADDDGG